MKKLTRTVLFEKTLEVLFDAVDVGDMSWAISASPHTKLSTKLTVEFNSNDNEIIMEMVEYFKNRR